MSGGHAHGLYVHEDGRLHRLSPQCKIAATVLFVVAVAATPRETMWAFAVHALFLVGVCLLARVPLGFVARRLVFEIPFVLFAAFLPFIGSGDRIEVFGILLSTDGLWAAWNVVAKATLGLAATILLAATTPMAQLLHGLEHLRLPRAFTAVAGFMVRYADLITGEMRRMSIARQSRGYEPRWMWQARAVAASVGTLFVRSYERGERVHLAMLSRGFDGTVPILSEHAASPYEWAGAMSLPLVAACVSALAWVIA